MERVMQRCSTYTLPLPSPTHTHNLSCWYHPHGVVPSLQLMKLYWYIPIPSLHIRVLAWWCSFCRDISYLQQPPPLRPHCANFIFSARPYCVPDYLGCLVVKYILSKIKIHHPSYQCTQSVFSVSANSNSLVIKTKTLVVTSSSSLCQSLFSCRLLWLLFPNISLLCAFYLLCHYYFSNEGPCLFSYLEGQGITPLPLSISNSSPIPSLKLPSITSTNLSQFLSVWSSRLNIITT